VAGRLAALGVVAGVFVLYAAGACPTIYVGDSGDLVTAVHVLGIPHPSGYPLYVLLGHLWEMLIPLGSIAWRMSLFSAAAAAATCGVVFALGRRAGLDAVAALFAALLLAASPSFWGEATVQRVYTLDALFVAVATACAWRWYRRRDRVSLAASFFVCGLGATNHTFMAVYAVALALAMCVADAGAFARGFMLVVPAFAIGLVPYLYLPLRARAAPVLNWGNPQTPSAFLDVVLRREFWDRAWLESAHDLPPVLGDYLRSFTLELGWAGVALALVGVVLAWRLGWPLLLLALVMVGNVLVLALHGSRNDLFVWHRYYIPSYLIAALLAGYGCDLVVRQLPRALRLLPLAIPALMLVRGWTSFDRSRYRIAEDYGMAVLDPLPPGARLFGSDDNVLFILMYLHLVEQRRPDVDLVLASVSGTRLPPLHFDPDREPVFFTHHPNWNVTGVEFAPVGVVFRTALADRPPPASLIDRTRLDGEDDPRVPKDDLTRKLIGYFHYMLGFTFERRDWPRAQAEFAAAAEVAPDDDSLLYNMGLILRRNGLLPEARAAFTRAQAINPRAVLSAGRPRAGDRLAELAAEEARLAALEAELARDPAIAGLSPASSAWHLHMADLLEARGETLAARAHRLRAVPPP
jgi:tetratricopeptide (TPR) repeat protein